MSELNRGNDEGLREYADRLQVIYTADQAAEGAPTPLHLAKRATEQLSNAEFTQFREWLTNQA